MKLYTALISFEHRYTVTKTLSRWSHDFKIVNGAIIGLDFTLPFPEGVTKEEASEVASLGKLVAPKRVFENYLK